MPSERRLAKTVVLTSLPHSINNQQTKLKAHLVQPEAVVVDVLRMLRLDGVELPGRGGLGEERRGEELAEPVQRGLQVLRVHIKVLYGKKRTERRDYIDGQVGGEKYK